jgi:SAM-dependent methyltransferase
LKDRKTEKNPYDADYWDSIVTESDVEGSEDLWRGHMKELYQGLQERWGRNARPRGRILKTDLYDEAISPHNLLSLLGGRCDRIVGTDLSLEIARAARRRMAVQPGGWGSVAVSDARNLAFRSCVFDEVVSNSTLDHFSRKGDIDQSLRELRRVMRPGATLTITLDNPWNPLVFLRNRLPYRFLRSLGLIPFYMGVTLSEPELRRTLASNGFRVCESTAIAHAPRILAIRAGRMLEKRGDRGSREGLRRLLRLCERLEALPTRYVTGYFVAVKAERE